jgi:hypothetical protein
MNAVGWATALRVLFVNPIGGLGGAEQSLLDALAALRSAPGLELSLLLLDDGPLRQRTEELGIPVAVLPLPDSLATLGEFGLRSASWIGKAAVGGRDAVEYLARLSERLDALERLSASHEHVVAERPRERSARAAQEVRPVARGERDPARAAVENLDVSQSRFMEHSAQIDLQQGGDVGWIKARCLLKMRKFVAQDDAELRMQAELIRGRHEDEAPWSSQARQLSHQRTWVLDVFDSFHAQNDVGPAVVESDPSAIQIDLDERNLGREPGMPHYVRADVARESRREAAREIARAASYVDADSVFQRRDRQP